MVDGIRATVVIPNWNGLVHLPECSAALSRQSFQEFDTLIVDNCSSDDSVSWVREHMPQARIIERADNGGFSRAVNEGILAALAEYVVLLNNDTAADPDWLRALVQAMDEHPGYDMAASMMVFYADPELVNAAGDSYSVRWLRGANIGFRRPVSEYITTRRVLGACAGAAIYRRRLFDEVGLFDEDYFLGAEDTDFNIRCLIAGKKCLYVPGARIRHKLGVSRDLWPSLEMERLAIRNEAMAAAKNLPLPLPFLLVPRIWWRAFRQTFPLRPSHWRRNENLRFDFWKRVSAEWGGFRMGWAKRPDVWRSRRASLAEIYRWIFTGYGPV
jgi:GT2 family glycosyltransferase